MTKIEDVVAELYAADPGDFTAARNDRAKELRSAGDTDLAQQVAALRKPTVGAWLVNLLVRELTEEMEQVLAVGEQLRAAQQDLAGDELRSLDKQRRQLVTSLVSQGRALGRERGHKISDQVAHDVEDTLRAALADETAADAVRTGALVDTFTASGLEPVDLDGLVALPGSRPRRKPTTKTARKAAKNAGPSKELTAAREALSKAEAALADATERRDEVAEESTDADARSTDAAARVKQLRADLRDAERDAKDAEAEAGRAAKGLTKAEQAHASAERAVERARAKVERLT